MWMKLCAFVVMFLFLYSTDIHGKRDIFAAYPDKIKRYGPFYMCIGLIAHPQAHDS